MPSSFTLKFVVDTAQAAVTLRSFTGDVQNRIGQIKEAVAGSGLGKLFEFAGAFLAVSQLKSMATEAGAAAMSQGRLDKVLQISGQYSAEYRAELARQADAFKDLTKTSETEIRQVQQKLIVYGAQKDSIEALTKATLDYAKFKEMDPSSAAELIGRSIKEGGMALRDFHIEIDKNADTPTRIRAITEALQAKLGGFANSNSPFKAYAVEIEDLRLKIGGLALEAEKPFFRGLSEGLRDVNAQVKSFLADHPGFLTALRSMGNAAGEATRANFGYVASFVGILSGVALLGTAVTLLKIPLGGLNAAFALVTGSAIVPFVRALFDAQIALGFFGGFAQIAGGSLASFRGALLLTGGALAAFGTLFAAFSLGGFISEFEVAGMKVREWGEFIVAFVVLVFNGVKNWVLGIGAEIRAGLESQLNSALTTMAEFAKNAADLINKILPANAQIGTGWAVQLIENRAGTQAQIAAALAKRKAELAAKVREEFADFLVTGESITDDAKRRHEAEQSAKSDAPEATGGGGGGGGSAKSNDGGSKAGGAGKAVDEAAEAQLHYAMVLDIVKGKVATGEFTQAQADAANVKAARDYIGSLTAMQVGLSPTSEKFQEITVRILAARAALQKAAEGEETYNQALALTKAKLEAGIITQGMAEAQDAKTITAYIARLRALQATLNPTSALFQQLQVKVLNATHALSQTSVFGKIRTQLEQLKREFSDVGNAIGKFLTSSINTGINAVAEGLTNLITKTGNWRDSFAEAGRSILSMLIQIVLQQTIGRAVISAVNAAFGKTDASAATADASTAATAWAPAATSASVATYGTAAGVGLAAYLVALATGTASAAAASSASGGFAEGGLIPGRPSHRDNRIAHVASGEYVMRTSAVQHYGVALMQALNSMQFPLRLPAYADGGLVGGGRVVMADGGGSGGRAVNKITVHPPQVSVNVMQLNTRAAMMDALRSAEGHTHIIDVVNRNRHRVGIRS